jgi:formylglycine-generating enzyme required for sulfatase activity
MRVVLCAYIAGVIIFAACKSSSTLVEEVAKEVAYIPKHQVLTIPGTEVSFSMTLLPEGKVTMGSTTIENEGPSFTADVASFWIGTHELTFDEYKIFRKKNLDLAPESMPDYDADAISRPSPPYEDPTFGMGENDFPAVSMTQLAALQYCKWLSDKTGEFYRLPTEIEWEYACKADGKTDYQTDLDSYAWHYDNSGEKYQKVGSKSANAWGLHDMLGNVSEWTLDQYKDNAYAELAASTEVNPWIKPTSLHPRTVRGGSWDDDKSKCRCSCRIESSRKWKERDPQIPKSFWWNTDSPFVGFRMVKPANPPSPEEQVAFWEMVLGG